MPNFPTRCQHIKVNGTQCGCPALRRERLCYFHKRHHNERIALNADRARRSRNVSFDLPVLEDADSIQVSLTQVVRLLLTGQLDPKVAGLTLYALQTASGNLRLTQFRPYLHDVVLDPKAVGSTPLERHVWEYADFVDPEEKQKEALRAQAAAEARRQAQAAEARRSDKSTANAKPNSIACAKNRTSNANAAPRPSSKPTGDSTRHKNKKKKRTPKERRKTQPHRPPSKMSLPRQPPDAASPPGRWRRTTLVRRLASILTMSENESAIKSTQPSRKSPFTSSKATALTKEAEEKIVLAAQPFQRCVRPSKAALRKLRRAGVARKTDWQENVWQGGATREV